MSVLERIQRWILQHKKILMIGIIYLMIILILCILFTSIWQMISIVGLMGLMGFVRTRTLVSKYDGEEDTETEYNHKKGNKE